MCYVTLRGLVYFGASIHVYHGVQMLVNMYYELFANSSSREGSVTQVDVIFNCCFFTLGLLLFRGVEQESKAFIKWPTISFTLLLASRFIIEIVKQIQREREGVSPHKLKMSMSPFSYSSMSIDVDPLISAAVGIYIFILFVYNHSLEFGHNDPNNNAPMALPASSSLLPFHHSVSGSECGRSDASSDTVQLIPSASSTHGHNGDTNNNNNGTPTGTGSMTSSVMQNNILNASSVGAGGGCGSGGRNFGNLLMIAHPISTIPNPLFELDSRTRGSSPGRIPPTIFSPISEFKIDAV